MGFHNEALGYDSISEFVDEMEKHERNHLKAFGKYLLKFRCLIHLKSLNRTKFAECYNGSAQAPNK